jgi:hypothetical protein
MRAAKGRKPMGDTDGGSLALPHAKNLGFVDMPADPEDEDRR